MIMVSPVPSAFMRPMSDLHRRRSLPDLAGEHLPVSQARGARKGSAAVHGTLTRRQAYGMAAGDADGPSVAVWEAVPRQCTWDPLPREVIAVPQTTWSRRGWCWRASPAPRPRATMEGRASVLVWEDLQCGAYPRWLKRELTEAHRIRIRRLNLDEAVVDLADRGIVKGLVVYRHDRSERSLHDRGPMDERELRNGHRRAERWDPGGGGLEGHYRALGLKRLADARAVTPRACLDRYERSSLAGVMCALDPRVKTCALWRSLAAPWSWRCPVRTTASPHALRARQPMQDGGWHGRQMTAPSSRAGLFQTATNWCHNLTVLSTEGCGRTVSTSTGRAARSASPQGRDTT